MASAPTSWAISTSRSGDQRPGDRGAEQIGALVQRIGAEHRKHVVAHELFAQVLDEDLRRAHQLGLFARRLELLALAQVGGEGHHLAAVAVLQPAQMTEVSSPPEYARTTLPMLSVISLLALAYRATAPPARTRKSPVQQLSD